MREGGESSLPALGELELRHFPAVRAFASVCAISSLAADELAVQAWRRALRLQDGSATGAVRPYALSEVLRTAADWAGTDERSALDADLAEWIESQPVVISEDSVGPGLPPPTLPARAFADLSDKSQTVLWHRAVEHDDDERIENLLGPGVEGVSFLDRRARRELYTSYVQILHDGAVDECRRFHRMVLAYADQKSIDIAADLVPHLEVCAYCSRAVADLGRMHSDCGTFLAQAILPWGGSEYASSSLPVMVTGSELVPHAAPVGSGRFRRAFGGGGSGAERGRNRRINRVLQSAALVALCSFVVALAYSGALRPGDPQSSEPVTPPGKSSQSPKPPRPAPSTATATATSTVTATKTTPSKPGEPSGTGRPSRPPVRGAALEWLFDGVDGGITKDTSGNGLNGTLVGSPLPRFLNAGAIDFDGQQSVAAEGPVVDTEESFSVSADVKLGDTGEFQTVASQDAGEISGFQLQYDGDEDRWEMRIPEEDSDDTDFVEAVGDRGPATGVSTHVTGVYDDSESEVRLYVDGRLEDTDELDGDFSADGDFVVGRSLEGDEFIRGFDGSIDDVRAFRKALSPREVRALARS
ncbi:LamG domain-containing protein [Streptomyces ovatisporus]|uniref:LamG domain-containing protein n=1 Tax=Streptomyces ovatisporus TaxID=1128682 RepID=A0ABV9A2C8_9ACTN